MIVDHDGHFPQFSVIAKQRNSTLSYNGYFAGVELDRQSNIAEIAKACGLLVRQARITEELTDALLAALKDQKNGKTTLIEATINQELGEPFRRDAMK